VCACARGWAADTWYMLVSYVGIVISAVVIVVVLIICCCCACRTSVHTHIHSPHFLHQAMRSPPSVVYLPLCLSVCLSLCEQYTSANCGHISLKSSRWIVSLQCFDVVGFGDRKGIRPVKISRQQSTKGSSIEDLSETRHYNLE